VSQWKLLDFTCPAHGRFEVLWDKRDGEPHPMPCQHVRDLGGLTGLCLAPSPVATTNAVLGRMSQISISTSKQHTDDRPDWCMNTENLADGQDPEEWKQEETKRITGRDMAADRAEMKDRGASFDVGSELCDP